MLNGFRSSSASTAAENADYYFFQFPFAWDFSMHLQHHPVATIAVSPMRSPFGILEIERDDIVGFKEKIVLEDKLVSIGTYVFNHSILEYLPLFITH
jgi:NDP-sugar pyrophosphorylase family protein